MQAIEKDWVQEKLKELKLDIENQSDSLRKQQEFARVNEHLVQYEGDDQVVYSSEIHEKLKKHPLPAPIKTNHLKLDDILGGFYPGQHVIIGAMPKSGKSEFIMDLVRKMEHENPLLLPFEQNADELITIMMERGRSIPLFAVPKTNKDYSIKWISERITESVVKFDTKVVFIDHFGYIKKPQMNAPYDMLIVELLQQIKNIAKSLNITIVTAVHTVKMSPLDLPTVEHLKGSAGFHQEADTIMMLWREAYKDKQETKWSNNVLLSVQANRRKGTTGSFKMKFEDFKYVLDDDIMFHYEDDGFDNDDALWKK